MWHGVLSCTCACRAMLACLHTVLPRPYDKMACSMGWHEGMRGRRATGIACTSRSSRMPLSLLSLAPLAPLACPSKSSSRPAPRPCSEAVILTVPALHLRTSPSIIQTHYTHCDVCVCVCMCVRLCVCARVCGLCVCVGGGGGTGKATSLMQYVYIHIQGRRQR